MPVDEKILRETESICPICCQRVRAKVVEKDSRILLVKLCPEHGEYNLLLSRTPAYYTKLEQFHRPLLDKYKDKDITTMELDVTFRCNMNCPICFLGEFKKTPILNEPSLKDIQNMVDDTPIYVLSGGEPTLREDLFSIIRILKRNRKSIAISTNGLKLADLDYVRKLKKTGIDRVNMQFDGFDNKVEEYFRGTNYLPIKLRALENLKQLKISTGLNAVVAKGINEEQVGKILEYALKNDFIDTVDYLSVLNIGSARYISPQIYIMPDQIIDIIVEYSKGKINKDNVYRFKKLLITISTFLRQRWCHYSDAYLLVRKGENYEPIDRFVNLQKIEPYLDKFQRLFLKNSFLARLFFLVVLPVLFIRYTKSIEILKELLAKGITYFFTNAFYLRSSVFLYVVFHTVCDAYKVDYVCPPCKCAVTYKKDGKICKDFIQDISVSIAKQNRKLYYHNG